MSSLCYSGNKSTGRKRGRNANLSQIRNCQHLFLISKLEACVDYKLMNKYCVYSSIDWQSGLQAASPAQSRPFVAGREQGGPLSGTPQRLGGQSVQQSRASRHQRQLRLQRRLGHSACSRLSSTKPREPSPALQLPSHASERRVARPWTVVSFLLGHADGRKGVDQVPGG